MRLEDYEDLLRASAFMLYLYFTCRKRCKKITYDITWGEIVSLKSEAIYANCITYIDYLYVGTNNAMLYSVACSIYKYPT